MSDRKTIGLTPAGRKVIDRIEGSFRERQQAARFAMTVAMAYGGDIPVVEEVDTGWNIGSFDSTGEIRAVMKSLYPDCEEPYRLVERLVNQGLMLINDRMDRQEPLEKIMREAMSAAAGGPE